MTRVWRNAAEAGAAARGGFALLEPGDRDELAPLLAGRARSAGAPPPARGTRPGEAPTRLPGRGQDYAQSRAYQVGDDLRDMHWALLARTGKPYVRVHEQEQALSWHGLLDAHGAMLFGTRVRTKAAQAARAVLAGAARQLARWPQSRLELSLWAAQGLRTEGFGHGAAALQRMAAWLGAQRIEPPALDPGSDGAAGVPAFARGADRSRADFEAWLLGLQGTQVAPAHVLLCSDFAWLDTRAGAALGELATRARVAALQVLDVAEAALPELPPVCFVDGAAATAGRLAAGARLRETFERASRARRERLRQALRALRIPASELCTIDSAARIQAALEELVP
jgi:uncharacterized protein (DUF58 family)